MFLNYMTWNKDRIKIKRLIDLKKFIELFMWSIIADRSTLLLKLCKISLFTNLGQTVLLNRKKYVSELQIKK